MGAPEATMTSPIGTNKIRSVKPHRRDAFTLVELILVMATLATALAFAAPRLSNFFRGRTLDSEGRRFLALTRYGQSRAVSEGVPMILWIDRDKGTYGLRAQDGYNFGQTKSGMRTQEINMLGSGKPVEFKLADKLKFDLDQRSQKQNQLATIRFTPDGSIDEESLLTVVIRQDDNEWIMVAQSENLLNYEIRNQTNTLQTIRR